MKRLLSFSQASTNLFVIFCCLLSPYSLLEAQGFNGDQTQKSEILLSQAKIANAPQGKITHTLNFDRASIRGKRMRLRGIYSEGILNFTRPRSWDIGNVKALIRFKHSTALDANRSNLAILVNDTAVGSIRLDRKQSQFGQVLVNIPSHLLQNYNELKIIAQQRNTEICVDPYDPSLWTEIQPDSKLVFDYKLKKASKNFSSYPYPIIDELDLKSNQINYLEPTQTDSRWLTAASRLQASLGRKTNSRPLNTKLVTDIAKVKSQEKLVIIGTPSQQPALAEIDLPVILEGDQILDADENLIAEDRGILILATTKNGAPILIATGNGEKGVEKAVQFLLQPDKRKIGTGQVVFVDKVPELSASDEGESSRYLPEKNTFQLSELETVEGENFKDVTVRGSNGLPVEINFRALPDERFLRGSSMNLVYSYGPQLNPRTSAVEVLLDGNFIGGDRLSNESGETRKTLKVDLPPKLIKPNSKIEVFFRMNSREPFNNQHCRYAPDRQLIGKVHNDTSFDLKRETFVRLPDLELLQYGFPFASHQDLSKTTIVVPQNPSQTDVLTLLEFSERLGQLSQASSVEFNVYTPDTLSKAEKNNTNIVAIGTQDKFPLPEVLEKSQGLNLSQSFIRLFRNKKSQEQAKIQVAKNDQGIIKEIISPWNSDRVVLALTAQTESGLDRVRQILDYDSWFFQLKEDTVLITSENKNPNPDDENAYELDFFNSSSKSRQINKGNPLSQISLMLQQNWLLLPVGIIGISLFLYGIAQLYLKRKNSSDSN